MARDEEEKFVMENYQTKKKAQTTTLKQALDIYENEFAKKLKGYSTENTDWSLAQLETRPCQTIWTYWRDVQHLQDSRREHVKDSSIRLDFAVITALFSNTKYGIENPAASTISSLAATESVTVGWKIRSKSIYWMLCLILNARIQGAPQVSALVVIFGIETACRLSEIVAESSKDKMTASSNTHYRHFAWEHKFRWRQIHS